MTMKEHGDLPTPLLIERIDPRPHIALIKRAFPDGLEQFTENNWQTVPWKQLRVHRFTGLPMPVYLVSRRAVSNIAIKKDPLASRFEISWDNPDRRQNFINARAVSIAFPWRYRRPSVSFRSLAGNHIEIRNCFDRDCKRGFFGADIAAMLPDGQVPNYIHSVSINALTVFSNMRGRWPKLTVATYEAIATVSEKQPATSMA